MSGPRVMLILDEDVPFMQLVQAAAKVGLRITLNKDFTARVEWLPELLPPPETNVRYLAARLADHAGARKPDERLQPETETPERNPA